MEGTTVGPYEVVRRLGAGAMGEVFLARDTRLDREVALKRIVAAADARSRILREARASARLRHPNIAAVYDVLDYPEGPFIVMEYVEGESLAARIARGPLAAGEAVAIGRQLASALAAAHRAGVIHRDLKPSNIQLAPGGEAKVLDFGIARLTAGSEPAAASTSALTIAAVDDAARAVDASRWANPGTPAYMAPEQLLGRRADERSDVYSLGAVLYEMTTGTRPYRSGDLLSLVGDMAAGRPAPAHEVNPDVPPWLSDVIAYALERNPSARCPSADALEAALAAGPGEKVVPARRFPRWVSRAAVAAAIIVAVAAAAARLPRTSHAAPQRVIVMALLPVDNPGGEGRAEYIGAGIASVVASNFGSIQGLAVPSRSSTAAYAARRTDLDALRREAGADYVLDMTVVSADPQPSLVVRLRNTRSPAATWETSLAGDVLTVETKLLDELGREIERQVLRRPLSAADWNRIRRVPTASSGALLAYSEARALLDQGPGAVDRAIDLLRQAAAADPHFALARATLGDALWTKYLTTKDPALPAQARLAVRDALTIDPDQPAVFYSLANMEFVTGRSADALASVRRAIALQPDSDDSHRLASRILADRGDMDGAIAEANAAIAIRPEFWNNYYSLGYILYVAGRYDAARDAYHRAADLAPTSAGAFTMLGTIEYLTGNITGAIGHYEHAARLGPNAQAYANLGLAYFTDRRYPEALAAYREALAREPKSVTNNRNIGDVYVRLGRSAEAKSAYERAIAYGEQQLAVNARDAVTIADVAVAEARLGHRDAAERHADEAVALSPTVAPVRIRAAKVHVVLGQTDAAFDEVAAAIKDGYRPALVRVDEDLEPLRKLPRFQELTATPPAAPAR